MAIGDGVHSWSLPSTLDAAALSEHVPYAIAQVLVKRGIDTAQKLNILLDPPHKLPYDPLRIAGMDTALHRLYSAVNDGERVGVFGDFDVDGITGTAISRVGLPHFSPMHSYDSRWTSIQMALNLRSMVEAMY